MWFSINSIIIRCCYCCYCLTGTFTVLISAVAVTVVVGTILTIVALVTIVTVVIVFIICWSRLRLDEHHNSKYENSEQEIHFDYIVSFRCGCCFDGVF